MESTKILSEKHRRYDCKTAEDFYNEGIAFLNDDQNGKAIFAFKNCIKLISESNDESFSALYVNAYCNIAKCLGEAHIFINRNIANAEYCLNEAVMRNPDNANSYLVRGDFFLKEDACVNAIHDYGTVIEATGFIQFDELSGKNTGLTNITIENRAHAYLNRAKAFYYIGMHNRAIEDINALLKLNLNVEDKIEMSYKIDARELLCNIMRGVLVNGGVDKISRREFMDALKMLPNNSETKYCLLMMCNNPNTALGKFMETPDSAIDGFLNILSINNYKNEIEDELKKINSADFDLNKLIVSGWFSLSK